MTAFGFAFVGAFFVLPAKNTWGERALNGLEAAALALGVILAAAFAYHLARYRRSGRRDEHWQAWGFLQDGYAYFLLTVKEDIQTDWLDPVGEVQCVVRLPDGAIHTTPDAELQGGRMSRRIGTGVHDATPGIYEVRWYGSRKKGHYHEITRGRFSLDGENAQRHSPL